MTGDTKLIIGIIAATGILLVGAIFFLGGSDSSQNEQAGDKQTIEQINVRNESYNAKGNPEALGEIVEFSDFECPACGSTAPVLNQVMDVYGNRVKLVYQHFPLSQHPMARSAAEAAEAAGLQGKFWEMHDALFANQGNLSEAKIEEIGEQIGLEIGQFNADRKSDEVRNKMLRDLAEGNRIGVNATPSIYINGELFNGLRSLEGIGAVLDQKLSEAGVVEDEMIVDTIPLGLNGSGE